MTLSALQVEITQADIDAGKPMSLKSDALCLALRRQTGQSWITDGCSAVLLKSYESHNLPFAARDFVRRFDAGERVQPVSFMTEVGP